MSEKSWASLAPLLDNRRYVESIVAGVKVQAHPDFRLVATMNDDASTYELPEYIHSRLQPQIHLDFPEHDEEKRDPRRAPAVRRRRDPRTTCPRSCASPTTDDALHRPRRRQRGALRPEAATAQRGGRRSGGGAHRAASHPASGRAHGVRDLLARISRPILYCNACICPHLQPFALVGHPRRTSSTPAVTSIAKPCICRHLRHFATRPVRNAG